MSIRKDFRKSIIIQEVRSILDIKRAVAPTGAHARTGETLSTKAGKPEMPPQMWVSNFFRINIINKARLGPVMTVSYCTITTIEHDSGSKAVHLEMNYAGVHLDNEYGILKTEGSRVWITLPLARVKEMIAEKGTLVDMDLVKTPTDPYDANYFFMDTPRGIQNVEGYIMAFLQQNAIDTKGKTAKEIIALFYRR